MISPPNPGLATASSSVCVPCHGWPMTRLEFHHHLQVHEAVTNLLCAPSWCYLSLFSISRRLLYQLRPMRTALETCPDGQTVPLHSAHASRLQQDQNAEATGMGPRNVPDRRGPFPMPSKLAQLPSLCFPLHVNLSDTLQWNWSTVQDKTPKQHRVSGASVRRSGTRPQSGDDLKGCTCHLFPRSKTAALRAVRKACTSRRPDAGCLRHNTRRTV
jgi:hypothetical protein